MSSTNSEQIIVSARANVMIYDDVNKKWNPSGSGPGLSKVYIYQHLLNQTYRVVGRKVQENHEVVINCLLAKGLKYNQANQTFLQWRDTKQVYGLHFQSKDEADTFTQTLKMAVENLNRLAGMIPANTIGNNNMNGNTNNIASDNISIGKRSVSSDYNPLYDENERGGYNIVHTNGNGMNHHTNGVMYNGNGNITNSAAAINMRLQQQQQLQQQQMQQQQQQQQTVTSPPLSTSSSTSSSSSASNGLSIAITNANQMNNALNGIAVANGGTTNGYGHHNTSTNSNSNNRQSNEFNGTNQIYVKQDQQSHQQQQQPLYQSSPIPPPPPPPPVSIFSNNTNGHSNAIFNNHAQNNSDSGSQKIYDVIPDTTNFNGAHTNSQPPQNGPPPPPPLPNGLFSNMNGKDSSAPPTTATTTSGGPPPPPPLPTNAQLLNNGSSSSSSSNNNSSNNSASQPSAGSYTNEIAKFQQNKLKKVEDTPRQPAQLDFLTEIRLKIEKKQQQQSNGVNGSDDTDSYKPSNLLGSQKKPAQFGGLRNQVNNQFDSPKTIKKNSSTPNVVNNNVNSSTNGTSSTYTNGSTNGSSNGVEANGSSFNLDKLKQELVTEFRKELQTFKTDIVNTILSEMRRQNN